MMAGWVKHCTKTVTLAHTNTVGTVLKLAYHTTQRHMHTCTRCAPPGGLRAELFYRKRLSDLTFVICAEDKGLNTRHSTQKWKLPRAQITNFSSPACSRGTCAQSGAFYGPDSQLVLLNKCSFSQTFTIL